MSKLLSIGFAGPNLGYAGGERGLLLLTIDGGATWQQLPTMFSDWCSTSLLPTRNTESS